MQKERLESIAEHIYGVQMLAIAMAEFDDYKNLDLKKYHYDDNFTAVSNCALRNNTKKLIRKIETDNK